VKAVGVGVFRYLLKPWDPECLAAELTKAFDFAESRNRNKQYRKLIEDELKYAGELQRAVLRPNLPTSEGVEFKASYRPLPAFGIGGDYYDVIYLGQRKYLVLIGDVAGHGVRAAIVTAILKAVIYPEYVRNAIGRDFSPAAFLEWLNERMNFELRSASDLVITFFAGVLDVSSATFR
jgi:sigma-B regulation protein RsbU (phosphoserine phosphatase)